MGSNDSQSQMYGLMLRNFYHELVEKEEQLKLHILALAALEGGRAYKHPTEKSSLEVNVPLALPTDLAFPLSVLSNS